MSRLLSVFNKYPDGPAATSPRFGRSALAVAIMASLPSLSSAMSFDLGDGATLNWDTTLRYTAAQRLGEQDSKLISCATCVNTDDGNRAFDKNSLIKNRVDAITEIDLNLGEVGAFYDLGAFVRARAWYDDVYNTSHDHSLSATSNNVSVPFNEFTEATRNQHGRDAEMLDYFIYAGTEVAGLDTSIRIGNQALNWGETLFLLGGVATSQGPVDTTGFNQPGSELKELFMPVEQLSIQSSLSSNLSVEAYYQWEWEKHRLDAAGSYFSTADMIDAGGESLILAPGVAFGRGDDQEARNSGQWGVAVRYLAEELAGTEFGLYYINYHDQLPQLTLNMGRGEYFLDYAEDVHLWAASFGTVIGSTNVSGEISYRENAPVGVKNALNPFAWDRAKLMHYSLSGIHIFGANALMDNLSVTAEIAADKVLNKSGEELTKDTFAYGYAMTVTPTWFEVLPALDVKLPISLSQGLNGNSAMGGSFVEDSDKFGVTLDLTYRQEINAQLGYVNFFGDANAKKDRDYISFSLKYAF